MTRAKDISKIVSDANFGGTLDVGGAFTSLGIDDNANATAITIDSSENVGIGTGSPNGNGILTLNMPADNSAQIVFAENDTAKWLIGHRHDGDHFRFYDLANSAEAIRIHSNQVLSASAGVALGVGTANTASNVLDDYEEGTWTPNIGGNASYTSQDGVYTKIGNMVHLQCKFQVNVRGTGSTAVLSGLPFASNNSWTSGSLSVSYYVSIATSMVWVSGYVHNNASTISFSGNSASATTIGHNGFAIFGNSARVDFQCSYRTA